MTSLVIDRNRSATLSLDGALDEAALDVAREFWLTDVSCDLSYDIIVDLRNTTPEIQCDAMRRRACQPLPEGFTGHIVIVAGRAATYGLARIYQTFRGEDRVGVFMTMDEAQLWLAGVVHAEAA